MCAPRPWPAAHSSSKGSRTAGRCRPLLAAATGGRVQPHAAPPPPPPGAPPTAKGRQRTEHLPGARPTPHLRQLSFPAATRPESEGTSSEKRRCREGESGLISAPCPWAGLFRPPPQAESRMEPADRQLGWG